MSPLKTILLDDEVYASFIEELAHYEWFFENNRCLYALALGGHRPTTFDAIASNPEIEIVWRGSHLPIWARCCGLGVIAAAYGGIVKVSGIKGMEIVCENLLHQAAVEFLVTSTDYSAALRSHLQKQGRKARALALAEAGTPGVDAVLFIDGDAMGEYPVLYRHNEETEIPMLQDYS